MVMVTKLDVTRIQEFLKRSNPDTLKLHDIIRLAELMTETMLIMLEGYDTRTHNGLSKISQQIADTKKELADLRVDEMHEQQIPEAGRELDAVVEATESATNKIMEAAETIMAGDASDPEAYSEMVNNNIIEIFEACSFQDITGQRIAKVVRVLNLVEQQVKGIISGLDEEARQQRAIRESSAEPQDIIGDLLNGPALDNAGVNQNDVDAMFS